jgi:protein-S-isoprenylcysteine O-methyltransferase Ste14
MPEPSKSTYRSEAGRVGKFAQRGGFWVVWQVLLLLAAFILGLSFRGQWHQYITAALGLVLLGVAALCGIMGASALGRNLTPFPRPSSNSKLVETGIYRWIRHPLYTSVICGSFSWALLVASWPALIISLALIPFFDAKARQEERWLRQQFPGYIAYEQRVRRFLPWIY